jgi:hypothetical protein
MIAATDPATGRAFRGMPTAVHEKQQYRMGFATGPLVEHLEHELTFV